MATRRAEVTTPVGVSPRVLIIDDNLDSRVEARRAVQRSSLEVAGEVGFGTEAVSFASETKPDVMLISVEEPVTRALETAEVLANVLPDTPFLFYSSLNQPEAVRRAAIYGARDYLVKPLQSATLGESVIRSLEFQEKQQMRRAGQLAAPSVRGTIITVAGAKGGIGKSVIALNLALALRKKTKARVVIVDADTDFGDIATMLDINPSVTAGNLIRDLEKLDRTKLESYLTEADDGLMVLAGPRDDHNTWEQAGAEAGRKIVELLSQSYDFVVVDTSGSMDTFVRELIEGSTLVLLVTSGEVSSVRDTKGALIRLKTWETPDEKIKVVLNRGARAEGFQAADLERTLDKAVFWEMPRDSEVPRSIQLGRPVMVEKPGSPASRHILALASAIGGNVRDNGQTAGLRGRWKLFQRKAQS
jgi:pilus assembly protein CpaE